MNPIRLLLLALGLVMAVPLATPTLVAGANTLELPGIAASLEGAGVAHAAFIRRSKLKKRPSIGYKVVVIVGDDADNNEVDTVDVVVEPTEEGGPVPSQTSMTLPLKVVKENGNKRFVFKDLDFSDDAVGLNFTITSTMRDVAGAQVGEPDVRTVEVLPDGDPTVRAVRIRQLDATNFRLAAVLVGDSEGDVASVDVEITDLIGNQPLPESLTLTTPIRHGGKATFFTNTLTFDDPSAAADQPYAVVATLRDNEGTSLGASDYEVVVEGLLVDVEPPTFDDLANTLNTSTFLQDHAVVETGFMGELLGVPVVPTTESFAVSAHGGIAYIAQLEDGSVLMVPEGVGTMDFGEEMFDFGDDVGAFVVAFPAGGEVIELRTHDPSGALTDIRTMPTTACTDPGAESTLKMLTNPEFGNIPIQMMYGDIIIGSMRLCDFND